MGNFRYEPVAGETIGSAASAMFNMANANFEVVKANFNGIDLEVDWRGSPEVVVRDYRQKVEAAQAAYWASDEGKKEAEQSSLCKARLQTKHDNLMLTLKDLDFKNDEALINWLCEYQEPSDYIGIVKFPEDVVSVFARFGYFPNVNCYENFNGKDRDNFARWLIGQALACLESDIKAIHPIIHKFAEEWKLKFINGKEENL